MELLIVNAELADPIVPSVVIALTLYTPKGAVSGIARVQLTEVEDGSGFVQETCVKPSDETKVTIATFPSVCP